MVLLRIEQFGKIPQRIQRGEINESTKKLLQIRQFRKVARYKVNVLKSITYVNISKN